ncbi:hypothetical protein [Pseudomonas helleri]|nr:hypothetical protein [Pseudomonas helleri]MQT31149.1 hypothetical protein [Pseudomonas helleri]
MNDTVMLEADTQAAEQPAETAPDHSAPLDYCMDRGHSEHNVRRHREHF